MTSATPNTPVRTVPGRCPICPPATSRTPIATGTDFEYGTTDQEFTIVRCDGCGTWLLDPRPADDEIARLYPPDYGPYRFDELPSVVRHARDFVQSRKVHAIARHAVPDARILDLGCGGGGLLRLLRKAGSPGWRLLGWDFPGPHLDRVRAQGFDVIARPFELADSPVGVADVVILNQVIEHFAEPDLVMRAVHRMLSPGGIAFLETPDVDGLDSHLFRNRYWGGFHFPRHLVLFHWKSLAALVTGARFTVVAVDHLASPSFWLQSVHHVLIERPGLRPLARLFTAANPLALGLATALDLATAPIHPTSNLRMVVRRD